MAEDVNAEFAKLMNAAREQAQPEKSEAPFGWMKDTKTGEIRPKKAAGRPRWKNEPLTPPTAGNGSKPRDASGKFAKDVPKPEPSPETEPLSTSAQRDPGPGWQAEDKGRKRRFSINDVPTEVVDDIAGAAGLIGIPLLSILQQLDPYCGTVLAQNFENIVNATLPLLCRSQRVVKFFSSETDFTALLALGIALKPVAVAIFEHHILGRVEVVRDPVTGVPFVQARQPSQPQMGDNLVPPVMPEYNYAA